MTDCIKDAATRSTKIDMAHIDSNVALTKDSVGNHRVPAREIVS